jgi:two-component system sensor histidine kinase PilS (NtrC family)
MPHRLETEQHPPAALTREEVTGSHRATRPVSAAAPAPESLLAGRLKVASLVRALVATVYFVSFELHLNAEPLEYAPLWMSRYITAITIAMYAYSLVLVGAYLVLRKSPRLKWLVPAEIGMDVGFTTLYAVFTGLSNSFFAVFYLVIIFFSAATEARRWFLPTVVLSVLAYALLVLVDLDVIRMHWVLPPSALVLMPARSVISNALINLAAITGVAILSSAYARFVRTVETERATYRQLKQIHEHLVEVLPVGLVVTDLNQRITLLNRYAKNLLKISEMTAERESISKYFRGLKPILDNREKLARGVNELTVDSIHGERKWLRWNISLLKDEVARDIGFLILFEDVTAVHALEARNKKMEELALIGRLAAGIVHEIRNPLASISGAIQVLSQLENLPDEERQLSRIILREVEHLSGWTEEFLSYARPKEPELAEADVTRLVEEVVTLFRHERGPHGQPPPYKVETHLDAGVHAWVDSRQLAQALRNILNNARDAVGEGGRITVRLERGHDHLLLRVEDNGRGVGQGDMQHLFEPFFTTKEAGTGLGLSIVQRIVEGHGGTVLVRSTEGQGTVVDLLLPRT